MLVAGSTRTSQPRRAIASGVAVLIPRSSAATRYRTGVPSGGRTTYGSGVLTTRARSAPTMLGLRLTRSISSVASFATVLIAARMAPRSRRCRVSARVPAMAIAVTPRALSSSSSVRADRQLDAIGETSLITKPLTQISRDS